MIVASPEQVRRLILETQGLRTRKPCTSIIEVARRIHNIQIDTISVVSRSHNLIVFNRFQDYEEGAVWKEERKGNLFEYWSHAMCLLPMDTFSFYSWKMARMREQKTGWFVRWGLEHSDIVEAVYKKVKQDGPTRSKDIGRIESKSKSWWDWKHEKRALEYLMNIGRLMVAYREGFQKYYDITERVVPAGIDTEPMPLEDIPRFVIDLVFRSLGVADYRDIQLYTGRLTARHLWQNRKANIEADLADLCGDLLEEIDFGQSGKYFVHSNYTSRIEKDPVPVADEPVKILTPFDNILRERHYPKTLWDFDYRIECYVPVAERKYGYFVLPILDQDELRGRVDAKVHRKTGVLELVSLYLEDDRLQTDDGVARLCKGLENFATFHKCTNVRCNSVTPRRFSQRIGKILEGIGS